MNTTDYLTYQKNREKVAKYVATLVAKQKSAWMRGVFAYAYELAEDAAGCTWANPPNSIEEALLNGARSWAEYSDGGNSLIYDADIAERLCSPSELKRSLDGERSPNCRKRWLDVQARALAQAARVLIKNVHRM